MRFPRPNIKGKIVLLATATSALSLLLAATIGYFLSRADYRRELLNKLQSDARFIAYNSAAALQFDSPEEAEEGLNALRVQPSIIGASILDVGGEHFATYVRPNTPPELFEALPESALGSDRILVSERIQIDGEQLGTIYIVSDLEALHDRAQRIIGAGSAILVAVSLFSVLVAIRLQRFISEPVRQLADTARGISERQDYSLRAEVQSADEMGALAAQFNEMLAQIQRQDRALRESHDRLEQRVQERTRDLEKAKEEAEDASRAKGDFLATMSHELRTPLNGIVGMMDLLSDSELTEEQRERVRVVNYSAESLVTIVNDILDFSKIEAGRLDLEPRPFDLEALIHGVGELLSVNAAEKGVDVFAHMDAGCPYEVVGDDGRIRQILLNIAGNAVKFTERGRVLIEARCGQSKGTRMEFLFRVEDTGIGIDSAKIDTIFDTFTQADASTTRKFGGTGLGLAIARRLVELMGGSIQMESELGRGTTVTFSLILEPTAESRASCQATPASILLVDNDAVTRRAYTEYLERWGFTVDHAHSEAGVIQFPAVEEDQERAYSMVLLGTSAISNPAEIVQALRSAKYTRDVPVLALGSPAHPQPPSVLAEAGINKYVEAYMTPSRLLDAVMTQLLGDSGRMWPAKEKVAGFAELESDAADGKQHRVLLVEDNVVNQKVAQGLLKRLGLNVDVAEDGQQALDRFKNGVYDLIFMDVQMPVMDGFAATGKIRREPHGEHIPIVAMTANAMSGDRERCIAAGMDDYLSKPLQGKLLRQMVLKYLGDGTAEKQYTGSILIVGPDSEAVAEISNAVLGKWPGAHVQTASTAMEACIKIGSRLPDCVVVHPATTGLDLGALTTLLESEERYQKIQVVAWGTQPAAAHPSAHVKTVEGPEPIQELAKVLAGERSGVAD